MSDTVSARKILAQEALLRQLGYHGVISVYFALFDVEIRNKEKSIVQAMERLLNIVPGGNEHERSWWCRCSDASQICFTDNEDQKDDVAVEDGSSL